MAEIKNMNRALFGAQIEVVAEVKVAVMPIVRTVGLYATGVPVSLEVAATLVAAVVVQVAARETASGVKVGAGAPPTTLVTTVLAAIVPSLLVVSLRVVASAEVAAGAGVGAEAGTLRAAGAAAAVGAMRGVKVSTQSLGHANVV